MNWDDYRREIAAVKFSEDFRQRTVERLEQAQGKEKIMMRRSRTLLLAACLAGVLLVTAAAAALLLSPGEAAAAFGDEALAAAFSGEDAVVLDRTAECGDYTFRLAGMVSGKGLSGFCRDVDGEKTYLVASRARRDGGPIEEASITDYTVTPLVAGYKPWVVNLWTLGGGVNAFLRDGVVYYIYAFDSVEKFAGNTVYLAIYEGGQAPGTEVFTMAGDGSISYGPGFEAPHAIFEVPLDRSKADPAAVEAFLKELGMG